MKWMTKINAIVLIGIICLVGVGVAGTETFTNKTDALAALGNGVQITPGDCTILTIKETITTGNTKGDIIATVQMAFNKPNFDRRLGKIKLDNTTQAEAENKAAIECERLWTSIQAEPQFQAIDTVVIRYEQGTLANILNRIYDVGKKTWKDITVQQIG